MLSSPSTSTSSQPLISFPSSSTSKNFKQVFLSQFHKTLFQPNPSIQDIDSVLSQLLPHKLYLFHHGITPLHVSASIKPSKFKLQLFELLMKKHGYSPHLPSYSGTTPLDILLRRKDLDTVQNVLKFNPPRVISPISLNICSNLLSQCHTKIVTHYCNSVRSTLLWTDVLTLYKSVNDSAGAFLCFALFQSLRTSKSLFPVHPLLRIGDASLFKHFAPHLKPPENHGYFLNSFKTIEMFTAYNSVFPISFDYPINQHGYFLHILCQRTSLSPEIMIHCLSLCKKPQAFSTTNYLRLTPLQIYLESPCFDQKVYQFLLQKQNNKLTVGDYSVIACGSHTPDFYATLQKSLFSSKKNFNSDFQVSIIYDCIISNNLQLFCMLFDNNSLKCILPNKYNAFQYAIRIGSLHFVKYMLHSKIYTLSQGNWPRKMNPFHCAALFNQVSVLRYLLNTTQTSEVELSNLLLELDTRNFNPIQYAQLNQNWTILKMLQRYSKNVDLIPSVNVPKPLKNLSYGWYALYSKVINPTYLNFVIKFSKKNQTTPMHLLAAKNKIDAILAAPNECLNLKNSLGLRPFDILMNGKYYESVLKLIQLKDQHIEKFPLIPKVIEGKDDFTSVLFDMTRNKGSGRHIDKDLVYGFFCTTFKKQINLNVCLQHGFSVYLPKAVQQSTIPIENILILLIKNGKINACRSLFKAQPNLFSNKKALASILYGCSLSRYHTRSLALLNFIIFELEKLKVNVVEVFSSSWNLFGPMIFNFFNKFDPKSKSLPPSTQKVLIQKMSQSLISKTRLTTPQVDSSDDSGASDQSGQSDPVESLSSIQTVEQIISPTESDLDTKPLVKFFTAAIFPVVSKTLGGLVRRPSLANRPAFNVKSRKLRTLSNAPPPKFEKKIPSPIELAAQHQNSTMVEFFVPYFSFLTGITCNVTSSLETLSLKSILVDGDPLCLDSYLAKVFKTQSQFPLKSLDKFGNNIFHLAAQSKINALSKILMLKKIPGAHSLLSQWNNENALPCFFANDPISAFHLKPLGLEALLEERFDGSKHSSNEYFASRCSTWYPECLPQSIHPPTFVRNKMHIRSSSCLLVPQNAMQWSSFISTCSGMFSQATGRELYNVFGLLRNTLYKHNEWFPHVFSAAYNSNNEFIICALLNLGFSIEPIDAEILILKSRLSTKRHIVSRVLPFLDRTTNWGGCGSSTVGKLIKTLKIKAASALLSHGYSCSFPIKHFSKHPIEILESHYPPSVVLQFYMTHYFKRKSLNIEPYFAARVGSRMIPSLGSVYFHSVEKYLARINVGIFPLDIQFPYSLHSKSSSKDISSALHDAIISPSIISLELNHRFQFNPPLMRFQSTIGALPSLNLLTRDLETLAQYSVRFNLVIIYDFNWNQPTLLGDWIMRFKKYQNIVSQLGGCPILLTCFQNSSCIPPTTFSENIAPRNKHQFNALTYSLLGNEIYLPCLNQFDSFLSSGNTTKFRFYYNSLYVCNFLKDHFKSLFQSGFDNQKLKDQFLPEISGAQPLYNFGKIVSSMFKSRSDLCYRRLFDLEFGNLLPSSGFYNQNCSSSLEASLVQIQTQSKGFLRTIVLPGSSQVFNLSQRECPSKTWNEFSKCQTPIFYIGCPPQKAKRIICCVSGELDPMVAFSQPWSVSDNIWPSYLWELDSTCILPFNLLTIDPKTILTLCQRDSSSSSSSSSSIPSLIIFTHGAGDIFLYCLPRDLQVDKIVSFDPLFSSKTHPICPFIDKKNSKVTSVYFGFVRHETLHKNVKISQKSPVKCGCIVHILSQDPIPSRSSKKALKPLYFSLSPIKPHHTFQVSATYQSSAQLCTIDVLFHELRRLIAAPGLNPQVSFMTLGEPVLPDFDTYQSQSKLGSPSGSSVSWMSRLPLFHMSSLPSKLSVVTKLFKSSSKSTFYRVKKSSGKILSPTCLTSIPKTAWISEKSLVNVSQHFSLISLRYFQTLFLMTRSKNDVNHYAVTFWPSKPDDLNNPHSTSDYFAIMHYAPTNARSFTTYLQAGVFSFLWRVFCDVFSNFNGTLGLGNSYCHFNVAVSSEEISKSFSNVSDSKNPFLYAFRIYEQYKTLIDAQLIECNDFAKQLENFCTDFFHQSTQPSLNNNNLDYLAGIFLGYCIFCCVVDNKIVPNPDWAKVPPLKHLPCPRGIRQSAHDSWKLIKLG